MEFRREINEVVEQSDGVRLTKVLRALGIPASSWYRQPPPDAFASGLLGIVWRVWYSYSFHRQGATAIGEVAVQKLDQYVKIAEAARFLGVSRTPCGPGRRKARYRSELTQRTATGCSALRTCTSSSKV